MRIGKHAVIGLALDIFDWALIGMVPGLGDVVDIVAIAYWTRKLGRVGLVEALELLPAADVLPINVALGMMIDGREARVKHV